MVFLFLQAATKSGKIRARKVNLLKPSSVSNLPYPLKFKVEKQAEFFVKRESLRSTGKLYTRVKK